MSWIRRCSSRMRCPDRNLHRESILNAAVSEHAPRAFGFPCCGPAPFANCAFDVIDIGPQVERRKPFQSPEVGLTQSIKAGHVRNGLEADLVCDAECCGMLPSSTLGCRCGWAWWMEDPSWKHETYPPSALVVLPGTRAASSARSDRSSRNTFGRSGLGLSWLKTIVIWRCSILPLIASYVDAIW